MSDFRDAESLVRQEQEGTFATLFTALPRGNLPSYLQALEDTAHHRLFMLRNNDAVRQNGNDSYTHDADIDLRVHHAIRNSFVNVLWSEPARPVTIDGEVRPAWPLRLTPLGIDAYVYLDRLLR